MSGRGERQEGLGQDGRLSPGPHWALQGAATRLPRKAAEQPVSGVVRRSPSRKHLQPYPLPSTALSSFDFLQPLGLLLTALMVWRAAGWDRIPGTMDPISPGRSRSPHMCPHSACSVALHLSAHMATELCLQSLSSGEQIRCSVVGSRKASEAQRLPRLMSSKSLLQDRKPQRRPARLLPAMLPSDR